MSPPVLCELHLLASARFDSQSLLCVVLAPKPKARAVQLPLAELTSMPGTPHER